MATRSRRTVSAGATAPIAGTQECEGDSRAARALPRVEQGDPLQRMLRDLLGKLWRLSSDTRDGSQRPGGDDGCLSRGWIAKEDDLEKRFCDALEAIHRALARRFEAVRYSDAAEGDRWFGVALHVSQCRHAELLNWSVLKMLLPLAGMTRSRPEPGGLSLDDLCPSGDEDWPSTADLMDAAGIKSHQTFAKIVAEAGFEVKGGGAQALHRWPPAEVRVLQDAACRLDKKNRKEGGLRDGIGIATSWEKYARDTA